MVCGGWPFLIDWKKELFLVETGLVKNRFIIIFFQLKPVEYIKYSKGKMAIYSYWKIWDNLIEIQDNQKKIISDLSELLEDTILLRTKNCSQQMAAFISGGFDSALISCIAKLENIYTAHYDYPDFDELEYAKIVADHIGKKIQIIQPQKKSKYSVNPYLKLLTI